MRIFCLSEVCCFVKVPGRGLEPLRISPPDPKSGASANFATLASTSAIDLTKIVAHRRSQRQMSSGRSFHYQTYTRVIRIKSSLVKISLHRRISGRSKPPQRIVPTLIRADLNVLTRTLVLAMLAVTAA